MTRQADQNGQLPPVEALRRIHAIVADTTMSPAARIAAAEVVLHADNETGLSWPGYRHIRGTCGVSNDAINSALACPDPGEEKEAGQAIDRHLVPAGHGPRGVQRYKVLPVGAPLHDDNGASAPVDGALTDGAQRSGSDGERSGSPPQRSAQRCETDTTELAHGTGPTDKGPVAGTYSVGAAVGTLAQQLGTGEDSQRQQGGVCSADGNGKGVSAAPSKAAEGSAAQRRTRANRVRRALKESPEPTRTGAAFLLSAAGFTNDLAASLSRRYDPRRIRAAVAYCVDESAVNLAGMVRCALEENWEVTKRK